MKTVQPITGRKTGELCRLLEERGIGDREIQQYLIEHPDDLVDYIQTMKEESWRRIAKGKPNVYNIARLSEINPFLFEGKKRKSGEWRLGYPTGFNVPSLSMQAKRLKALFGDNFVSISSHISNEIPLPDGADGVALIPTIMFMGKLWGIKDPHGHGYKEILRRINTTLEKNRPVDIFNYHRAYDFIRINQGVLDVLLPLEEKAERASFNCLTLPFSFGRFYADFGCRNARWIALYEGQLPLTTVQTGCLLLAMPDRLVGWDDLPVNCPGDECDYHDSDHYPNGTGKWNDFLSWEIIKPDGTPPYLSLCKSRGYGDTGTNGGSAVAFPSLN